MRGAGVRAKLLVSIEGASEVPFPLVENETLIGRLSSADLVLEDRAVSRVHAKIVTNGERHTLIDLESSTGTKVNGVLITRRDLIDGDQIDIGPASLKYELKGQHASPQ